MEDVMPNGMKKFWVGSPPEQCDICKEPVLDTFIDGATRQGPWAIMHPRCHTLYGVGLGTGRGQRYERQGEQWPKVAG